MVLKMTRDEATELLDCSLLELANLLGITSSAIAQWNKYKIPLLREYQIRSLANQRVDAHQIESTLLNQVALKND